jgi:hypothetical protein
MDKRITGILHRPPASTRRTLIKWENPISIRDGYSVYARPDPITGKPVGQFAFYTPYLIDNTTGKWVGTWSANQAATILTLDQYLKIMSLQSYDSDGISLQQKVKWLTDGGNDTWGAPIRATYPDAASWALATNIKMIAAVYAGQPVEVVDHSSFTVLFNNKTETIPMSRIHTTPPAEWTRENMMLVTAVNDSNVYYDRPQGLVRLPVWFGDRQAWLPDRWLV